MSFSTDVFLSSPPRPRTFDPVPISSSSPYLPSLDEIFLKGNKGNPKNSPLRTGTPATPIPANVRTTFTSAADILRQAPEIDIDTETITRSPSRRAKITTKSPRRKTPTPDSLLRDRDSNQPVVVIGSLSPKDKPWQKYKAKPSTHHGSQSDSSSTYRNHVTSKKPPGQAKETVSRHFAKKGEGSLHDNRGENTDIGGDSTDGARPNTPSELAFPRRGDWTPPRANEPIASDPDSDMRELFSSASRAHISKQGFQALCSQFGREDPDREVGPSAQPQVDVLRKRKRIELISTGQEEAKGQPNEAFLLKTSLQLKEQKSARPRESSPKRKTRTITELALAPFAAPLAPDLELVGTATEDSMLGFFDADGAVKALVEHQSAVMSQRKPKAKEMKQPPSTKRKKKAGTQANPILLSPSSALKQSSNQDFVFGTSSQLVQEESPTTLRDIQAAIRASDSLNSDPFDEGRCQRLWHAGARDEDGELMEMEVIDLQHGSTIIMEPNSNITPGGRSFVDINDILNSPGPVSSAPDATSEFGSTNSHFFQSQSAEPCSGAKSSESEGSVDVSSLKPRPNYELFTDAQLGKQITSYGFKPVKQRAAMIALLDQCWASKHQGISASSVQPLSTSARSSARARQEPTIDATNKAAAKPPGRGRPKKDSNTIASIDPPTTSDKPAPKRPRNAKKKEAASTSTGEPNMEISSPKRSRVTKRKEAASTATEEPSMAVSSPKRSRVSKRKEAASAESSPKRQRARSRKSNTPSVEIPDSDNETPSPMSSPDPVFSSPPPPDLTISDEGDLSLTLSPTDNQTELFRHITQAVTSAPRSQDPSKPSWHEKMLLYDPIILEELAAWLNSGELTRIGYDREVSPVDVKNWCESKSVICLWRQNLRGKERKRY